MKFYHSDMEQFTNIVINRSIVGVAISGGVSSTLLLYLLAKKAAMQNIDVVIKPFHLSIDGRAKTMDRVRDMVTIISDVTGFANISDPWFVEMSDDAASDERRLISFKLLESLFQRNRYMQQMYYGTTKNPNISVYPELAAGRDAERDTVLKSLNQWKVLPFCELDKSFVLDLYVQHGLIENILPLTVSCSSMEAEADPISRKCGTCFSCREETWALSTTSLGR